ncbi:molybdopterin synthase catalytic subunit MoaE [Thalassotalea agarivorans]|uniref:Molybdopterin synthase catalytic subunit n=1 Tax=Thalassotalea agarivorans TaxID=349064 RepID=A0A1I0ARD8_THASX|nr:molybdopterin synthase catalytic subunit MoaE [Thalassotalea agarivorans]SES96727.1 molybdopterin synthase subunit MoaE [Thalassotalea agarivorans]
MEIAIQHNDFSVADEIAKLEQDNVDDGATVTFTGRVRAQNNQQNVTGLFLEHYPEMTEKMLTDIIKQARSKWQISKVRVIHRVGHLSLGDNIVFVGVTSRHRTDAFASAEFIMDFLKVKAPFWKKETTEQGEKWLDAKASDHQKASNWE